MYRAKAAGKNTFVYFNPNIAQSLHDSGKLSSRRGHDGEQREVSH
jgi:hypothetical protein